VWVVADGQVREDSLDPAQLGLPSASVEDLRGGDATHNADIAREVLGGGGSPAVRGAVALNAAAGLVAAAGTTSAPVAEQLRPALARAHEVLASGEGLGVLRRWVKASNA
jgi:anthranilate phosphoribosyltransferase